MHRSPSALALAVPALVAGVVFTSAGCPAGPAELCGLSTAAPEVDQGEGSATRSDGDAFAGEAAFWEPGTNAAVTIGTLTLTIPLDSTGAKFDDLIADGALPFCANLGERDDTSVGSANFPPAFVTNASHEGAVAVISLEDNFLVGRFAVTLENTSTVETLEFTEGVFSAGRL